MAPFGFNGKYVAEKSETAKKVQIAEKARIVAEMS